MTTEALVKKYSVAEFLQLDLPEEGEPYELLEGVIVSKKSTQGPSKEHGTIISNAVYYLKDYLKQRQQGLVITGPACQVGGSYLKPDVGFWLADRIPVETGVDLPYPDLAIEVVSKSDVWFEVRDKAKVYLKAGTALVWVIFWPDQEVYAYHKNHPKKTLTIGDELDSTLILPNFKLAVSKLFEDVKAYDTL